MPPGEAVQLLAEQVDFESASFVTAFVALIDTRSGMCTYANGGHPPALLSHNGTPIRELGPTGPLIGPFPGEWRTEHFAVEPGGKLVVYTDGLSEARDEDLAFYGTERLAGIVASLPCEQAEAVLKSCLADLAAFTPRRMTDDVTMVLVCRACEPDDEGAEPGGTAPA
jgi:sigma-B regulation protein RsbU (phosphoserine phosphatase)